MLAMRPPLSPAAAAVRPHRARRRDPPRLDQPRRPSLATRADDAGGPQDPAHVPRALWRGDVERSRDRAGAAPVMTAAVLEPTRTRGRREAAGTAADRGPGPGRS